MQIRCLVTSQCGHCCKTTKFGISVLMLSLQSWNFAGWLAARTAHCDSVYYITAATYSLPDLYLPKMKKMPYYVASEFNILACAVYCPYSLTPIKWTARANSTCWRRKTLILPFEWRGPGAYCNLPWKCHGGHIVMELCDECKTLKSFSSIRKKSWENQFLWFYITLCPHCDFARHLICINQNLE